MCPFCLHHSEKQDKKNFIIRRFAHTFVMLNLYPYNSGHILVLPYSHVSTLAELTPQTRTELIDVCNHSCLILTKQLHAQGFNIGINMGKAAGAGMPDHVHMHVLPRWYGDTNFLQTFAMTRQISINLEELFTQLAQEFSTIDSL